MADQVVSLGLDATQLKKELNKVKSDLTDINKLSRELGKGNDLAAQFENASKKCDTLNKKIALQEEQIRQTKEKLKEYRTELNKLDEGSDEFQKLSLKIEKTETSLNKMTNEVKLSKAQLSNATNEANSLKDAMSNLGKSVDNTEDDFKSINKTLSNINFVAIGQSIKGIGQSMVNFGTSALNGFGDGIDSAREFSSELDTLQFKLEKLPKEVQDAIDKAASNALDKGYTENQFKQIAISLSDFLSRNNLLDKVDNEGLWDRVLDLAALYDLDVSDVADRIQKMLLGNFENSDALGFNMTVGSVESWSGVDTKKMSESQKQLLYLKYILDQTSSSVGRAAQETDSWQGRLKNLQTTVDETKNSVFSYIGEALDPLFEKLQPIVNSISDWIKDNSELAGKIGLVALAVTGIVTVLGGFLIGLGTIVTLIPIFSSGLGAVGSAIGFLMSPIGLIIAAIAALTAGIVYLWNNNEGFRTSLIAAWDAINQKVSEVIDFLSPYISTFIDNMMSWWNDTLPVLISLWDSIKDAIGVAIDYISTYINNIFTGISNFLTENSDFISYYLSSAWEMLSMVISGVCDVISTVISTVFDFIKDFIDKHGEQIYTFLKNTWNDISIIVSTVTEAIKTVVSTVFNFIKNFLEKHGETIKTGLKLAWEGIVAVIKTAISTVSTVIESIIDVGIGIINFFSKVFKGNWKGAWDTIKTTVKNVVDNFKELAGKIVDHFKGIASKIADGFTGLGDKIMNKLPSWLRKLINGTLDLGGKLLNSIGGVFGKGKSIELDVVPSVDPLSTIGQISVADYSSPYLTRDSAESQAFTSTYSTVNNYNSSSSSIVSASSTSDKKFFDELKKLMLSQQPILNINIENVNANNQTDIDKLIKQIEARMRVLRKSW